MIIGMVKKMIGRTTSGETKKAGEKTRSGKLTRPNGSYEIFVH